MLQLFLAFVIIVISATHIRITASHKSNEVVIWPEGSYGLPRAKSGCPKTDQFAWDQGWRLQNLDNSWRKIEASELSNPFNMDASLVHELLSRAFCTKQKNNENSMKRRWPKGSYCIYQYGVKCPPGMVEGYIKWDDNNPPQENRNQKLGSLPRGDYTYDTVIYYCCQNQSTWYDVIELPTTSPFYLLPYKPRSQYSTECQRVKWALPTLEYIRFDTEDDNNQDVFYGHHVDTDHDNPKGRPKVHYCYYESCQHKLNETEDTFNSSGHSVIPGYPSYQSCSWLITVGESFVVSLNLTSVYISKCKENFLKIYDGANEASPRIATYCESKTPEDIEVFSSGMNIYVVLKSGNLSQHLNYSFGFNARYGPTKIIPTPLRTPHNVEVVALTFSALLLIFVAVAIVIGYRRRSKNNITERQPTSRFHVPSTISLETLETPAELPERVPSCKETRNPYYVTARLWDKSSISRSTDNVAYATSLELNHGYINAPGTNHTA